MPYMLEYFVPCQDIASFFLVLLGTTPFESSVSSSEVIGFPNLLVFFLLRGIISTSSDSAIARLSAVGYSCTILYHVLEM